MKNKDEEQSIKNKSNTMVERTHTTSFTGAVNANAISTGSGDIFLSHQIDPICNGTRDYLKAENRISSSKILFLGANPSNTSRLKLDEEVQKIQINLKLAKERENLEFHQVWAVTVDSLMQAMLDNLPTIVHFSGHGEQQGIILQDAIGAPQIITGDALATLFQLFKDTLKCVVLNSCYSENQAKIIKEYIPHVIGIKAGISDKAAISFSTGFYKAIGSGKDFLFAFRFGIAAIKLKNISEENIPFFM